MYDQATEGSAGALGSEWTRTTSFACPDIGPGEIAMTSTTVVQGLARRADIAIVFRFVAETLGTIEGTVLAVDTVAGSHVGKDVVVGQPL